MNRKFYSLIAYTLGFIILLTLGIGLFFVREHKISPAVAHELRIKAHPATRKIVNDQYLILTQKTDFDLYALLDSLNLEINTPLLNWTLVSKKGQKEYRELLLSEKEAEDDRLVIRSLLENPHIISAEHNFVFEGALLPNNHSFQEEWQLLSPSPTNPSGMNLIKAWDLSTGSDQVRVAIIDNFLVEKRFTFAERFPECLPRVHFLEPNKDFIFSPTGSLPHGEIMLLALGACSNTGSYSTGIDWHAELMAVQRSSEGAAQSFLTALYASGIDVCKESRFPCKEKIASTLPAKPADIILLPFSANAPELMHFSTDMINAIAKKNIATVAAAGNNHHSASNFLPGATPKVITIGALDKRGKRAPFSNWGPTIDLLAPGAQLDFSYPNGPKKAEGTSISAAYAAGVLALMKSLDTNLSHEALRYFLSKSARPLSCENYCEEYLGDHAPIPCPTLCCGEDDLCGKKALDAYQALELSRHGVIDAPLLTLDRNFVLFSRGQIKPERILAKNIGNKEGVVKAVIYDDNLVVEPQEFPLLAINKDSFEQEITISFKREPFSRQTSKVEFITYYQGRAIDKTELYLQYTSKK